MTPEYLTTKEAASYLGVSPRTLEGYRQMETGPAWKQPEGTRLLRYKRSDLDGWMSGEDRPKEAC